MARTLILPGLLLVVVSLVGCTAPEEEFSPQEGCEQVCSKTAACGWSAEIEFNQQECESKCVGIHANSVELGCDGEWESAIRCSLREYTCDQQDTDPCEEENDVFSTCIDAEEQPVGAQGGSTSEE